MIKNAFFVASTGQNVGKTTACLGLLSGLKKRFPTVGFIKPVGQEHVETSSGLSVDKDVDLFKDCFNLEDDFKDMSPVLFPSGFTRDYLDGKVNEADLVKFIRKAFLKIHSKNAFTLVEGTGHVGVGSIVNLNNAQVSSLLELPMVIVASGGLGSTFDELSLNKIMCEHHGSRVIGIILNKVIPEKKEMILHYMNLALERWNIPILGCIPFDPFLSNPSMKDFETLFDTSLLSGAEHRMRHFKHKRLVATSVDAYRDLIVKSQLIITPANREDIILSTLTKHWDTKIASPDDDLESGMILTGSFPPRHAIVEQLKRAHIPMLYAPVSSYNAMTMISSFTAKIRKEDIVKIDEAIDLVEHNINFDLLLQLLTP
jgi:phosphate acetyltransferase